jgi:glutamyl-tRNA synthetase
MSDHVGRLAPSPTGRLHLGVARTSLVAWLDARAAGGRLLLRVEDIDTPRVVPGAAEAIARDLRWLGIDWDEGPDVGGPRGPYVQSARTALYEAALSRLGALGRTFACTCTRKEVALAASAPHGPADDGPRYPGTCREAPRERPGRAPAIRLRTEPGDRVVHRDRLLGALDEDVFAATGDFVLLRSDGLWAYQLAVTVDDLAQGVTSVVRGADLLGSTPRQALLRRLLDPTAPPLSTLHVPLVLGPGGQRLAKRDRAASVAELREGGATAEQVVGWLAASLGLVPSGTRVPAAALLPLYDPARLPQDPVTIPSAP